MKNKGITLISLVITIVVLIILSSVAIYLSLGNSGIFTRAKQAKETTNKQTATEIINLKITTAQMNKYAEKQVMPTLKELSEVLRNDSEIQYVTEKSQIASTKYEVGENPNSIFTKLNEYPYEFEINGQLQLASINGVKVATNNNGTMPAPKLLWQNPDPISDENGFAAQTITLSENNCDIFEIYYYNARYGNIRTKAQKLILNKTTQLDDVSGYVKSQGTIASYRGVTSSSNTSIVFEDAYLVYTGYAPTVTNIHIIPVYVLGYETGIFSQNN